jgi:hypothetical protein
MTPEQGPDPIRDVLCEVTPDALTPKDALDLIYRLRALLPAIPNGSKQP